MNNQPKRNPDGQPMLKGEVATADAVALLSGVNYGSVVRVLAALSAIADERNDALEDHDDRLIATDDLLSWDKVPTEPVRVKDPEHKRRMARADAYVRRLVKEGYADPFSEVLLKLPRFK